MRLLTATDFALRTLMSLAAQPDRHISTEELARDLAVSRHHLQKVVQTLTEGGFVQTVRGAKGGVMLSRPASLISIGAVVRWFEQDQAMVDCFRQDGVSCTLIAGCSFKGMLSGAREAFFAHLDRFTLDQGMIGSMVGPEGLEPPTKPL